MYTNKFPARKEALLFLSRHGKSKRALQDDLFKVETEFSKSFYCSVLPHLIHGFTIVDMYDPGFNISTKVGVLSDTDFTRLFLDIPIREAGTLLTKVREIINSTDRDELVDTLARTPKLMLKVNAKPTVSKVIDLITYRMASLAEARYAELELLTKCSSTCSGYDPVPLFMRKMSMQDPLLSSVLYEGLDLYHSKYSYKNESLL